MVQKVAVSCCFTTTELRFSSFLRQWRSWCLEMYLWLQPVGFVLCRFCRHLTLLSPDADEPGCCAHGDEGAISQILPRAKWEPELRHVPLAASRWKDLNLKGSERIGLLNQLQSIQIGPV